MPEDEARVREVVSGETRCRQAGKNFKPKGEKFWESFGISSVQTSRFTVNDRYHFPASPDIV